LGAGHAPGATTGVLGAPTNCGPGINAGATGAAKTGAGAALTGGVNTGAEAANTG